MPAEPELIAQSKEVLTSALAITLEREQTRAEELANTVSHAVGLAAALAAGTFLIAMAARLGDTTFLVGIAIYAVTMALLYLGSTLYHATPAGPAKAALLVCDHSAIYLFIAGSFTPFAFGVLRGPWGFGLGLVVWALALAGVGYKLVFGAVARPWLSTLTYVAMGWVLLLAAFPLWHLIAPAGLLWLLAGGVLYTAGIPFFRAEQVRYAHFVWHLFVIGGTVCHFIAIVHYAAGA